MCRTSSIAAIILPLFLVAFLSTCCWSAPFEIPIARKSLLPPSLLQQRLNPEQWLQRGVDELTNGKVEVPKKAKCPFRNMPLLNKFNADSSDNKMAAMGGTKVATTGSQMISDFVDTFLVAKVSVGTPAQKFNMILDSTMFVFYGLPATFVLDASTCEPGLDLPCEKMRLFDKSLSNTYKRLFSYKNFTLAKDIVSFGGIESEAKFLLLNGNKFVGKNSFQPIYDAGALNLPQLDGMFSMAFSSSLMPIASGMEYLLKNAESKIATVYIEPISELDFFAEQKGAITVGALDTKRCEPNYAWTRVPLLANRWQIPLRSVQYDGLTFKGGNAFFSTFHTFIYGPREALDHILGLVKPLKQPIEGKTPKDVAIECDRTNLPNINFQFGNEQYTLTPQQYVLDVVLDPKDRSKNICHLMVRPIPNDLPDIQALMKPNDWFFGQLFFNQFCVAFDYTQFGQRIGLAKHL